MPKSKLNEHIRLVNSYENFRYHVFIDVFEKHRFADKPSSRVADKYSASNLPSVPHIMDIAVT